MPDLGGPHVRVYLKRSLRSHLIPPMSAPRTPCVRCGKVPLLGDWWYGTARTEEEAKAATLELCQILVKR